MCQEKCIYDSILRSLWGANVNSYFIALVHHFLYYSTPHVNLLLIFFSFPIDFIGLPRFCGYMREKMANILQLHWTHFHCLPFCLIWLNKMRIWEEPIKREVLNRFLKIFTANLSKTITRGWLSLKLAFISLPAALLLALRVILPHEDPGVKFNESFMGMPMSIYGETLKSYKLKFFQYSLTIIVDFEKSVLEQLLYVRLFRYTHSSTYFKRIQCKWQMAMMTRQFRKPVCFNSSNW